LEGGVYLEQLFLGGHDVVDQSWAADAEDSATDIGLAGTLGWYGGWWDYEESILNHKPAFDMF